MVFKEYHIIGERREIHDWLFSALCGTDMKVLTFDNEGDCPYFFPMFAEVILPPFIILVSHIVPPIHIKA